MAVIGSTQEEDILTPIACTLCNPTTKFVTYIIFDMELHLYEIHGLRSGYKIEHAINEGKELGVELDSDSLQKLDLEYSKYLDKTPSQVSPIPATVNEGDMVPRPWSQLVKNSITPVISVEEFFRSDDKTYSTLRTHSLELSPCYPIISVKPVGRHILYCCEICHPEFANDSAVANINLSSMEHHCLFRDPERHKTEILARLAES